MQPSGETHIMKAGKSRSKRNRRIRAEKVERAEKEAVQAERKAYMEAFAKEMEQMLG